MRLSYGSNKSVVPVVCDELLVKSFLAHIMRVLYGTTRVVKRRRISTRKSHHGIMGVIRGYLHVVIWRNTGVEDVIIVRT